LRLEEENEILVAGTNFFGSNEIFSAFLGSSLEK
jgi:hypothetical protein